MPALPVVNVVWVSGEIPWKPVLAVIPVGPVGIPPPLAIVGEPVPTGGLQVDQSIGQEEDLGHYLPLPEDCSHLGGSRLLHHYQRGVPPGADGRLGWSKDPNLREWGEGLAGFPQEFQNKIP